MDLNKICRICLKTGKQTFDIYSSYYWKRKILYLEMLISCTKLKPFKEDGLPNNICRVCTKQLKRTYAFNLLCEGSDKKLRDYIKNDKTIEIEVNSAIDVKDEFNLKKEEELCYKDVNHKVLEIVDQNVVQDFPDEIKIEPEYLEEANDSCWEADDNTLLVEIKKNKDVADDDEKPKKKRGRKKKEFNEGAALSKTPHQCDVCGKVLSTRSNLKAHKICHTDLRPYHCDQCPATFRGHSALFQHRRVHSGETPYHCEYCPKRFCRRSGLVNHIRMHTGERQYSCEICFKTFVQSGQLSIHMKRHKGDKAYLCQDCGKGFAIKADLRVHQRIHNGEKPFSCHLCTKSFTTSGNLAIHIRIHKKEIRYNCKECQRGFVTNSAFNIHMKRHRGQRDFHCECGKTFYTSSGLKQHKVVHTGEKNYQCKICERKFTQASHLSRHFKRDHAKQNAQTAEHYKMEVHETKSVFDLLNRPVIAKLNMSTEVKCEGS